MTFVLCLTLVSFGFLVGYWARDTQIDRPKQTTWIYCPGCKRDLTTSPNVIVKDEDRVHYYCGFCNTVSSWDFDFPVPILIDASYKDPNDWMK